jgi:hypothetical protein
VWTGGDERFILILKVLHMSDVNQFARGLLDFAAQSVDEGLSDPSSLLECLSEADCALRILRKHVRELEGVGMRLMLYGLGDSLVELVKNNPNDFERRLQQIREGTELAKQLFV